LYGIPGRLGDDEVSSLPCRLDPPRQGERRCRLSSTRPTTSLLHAAQPSRPFREELARRAARLVRPGFEMRACPRVHLKMIAIDGALLYLGSANLTGAGLGAKSEGRRNFEMGVLTDDEWLLDQAQARFDRIWRGLECAACRMRSKCPRPIDVSYAKEMSLSLTATRMREST